MTLQTDMRARHDVGLSKSSSRRLCGGRLGDQIPSCLHSSPDYRKCAGLANEGQRMTGVATAEVIMEENVILVIKRRGEEAAN
jgi:hypothetical protein